MDRVESWVQCVNENLSKIRTRGPYSKYDLSHVTEAVAENTHLAKLELVWPTTKEVARLYEGIACDLESDGHKALVQATSEVMGDGNCSPYSISGSLPLVRYMQREGFDLQLDGFGLMITYHNNNEYCRLKDMRAAYEILLRTLALLN